TPTRAPRRSVVGSLPLYSCAPASPLWALADALELGRQVALQRLAHRGHVHGVHEVALDQAVEARCGVVLLGVRTAQDTVGPDLDLRRARRAVVHLDDPGRVGQQELDL